MLQTGWHNKQTTFAVNFHFNECFFVKTFGFNGENL